MDTRYAGLLERIRPLGSALVAFSGGVDSLFVARAALDALGHEAVVGVTLCAPYTPSQDRTAARQAAAAMGLRHEELDVPFPEILRNNPPERCYLCKRLLFGRLVSLAAREGLACVLDGSNADDLDDHRPGMQAVGELGIGSPLLAAGLTKADVRRLSRERGLPGWDRPAGACLLTRLPHGTVVTGEELARIDAGETVLRDLGFPEARLRSHGNVARIEVDRAHLAALVVDPVARRVDDTLKNLGYAHVAVDLAGYRRGNLNAPGTGGQAVSGGQDAAPDPTQGE